MDLTTFNYERRPTACFLLGAGASRGGSFVQSHSLRLPPMDADFFSVLRSSGLNVRPETKRLLEFVESEFGSLDIRMESFYSQAYLHDQFVADIAKGRGRRRRYQLALQHFRSLLPAVFAGAIGEQECDYHRRLAFALDSRDSVISFNYDCLIDRALARWSARKWEPSSGYGFEIKSGLDDWKDHTGSRGRPFKQTIRLLKPHGSFNWRRTTKGNIALRSDEYEDRAADDLVIVPPLWQKSFEVDPYPSIWKQARSVLSSAKALFVIGYSMPETDVYTQATLRIDVETLDFLCVVNPDAESRHRVMRTLSGAVTSATHIVELGSLSDLAECIPGP
jgi:hypothetical protein